MLVAAKNDIDAFGANKPAIHKLAALPRVVGTLQKYAHSYLLVLVLCPNIPDRSHLELIALDQGILGAIKEWLVPLADRSLPALNIQRALFAILAKVRGVFAAKS